MSKTSTEPLAGAGRRVSLNGPAMGSRWTAVWFDDGTGDPLVIGRRLVAAVAAVEAAMSTWIPTSNLMRLNHAPVGPWLDLPADLATVLAVALRIGRATGGAFDIGVGALVADWGFGAHAATPTRAAMPLPTALSIDALDVDEAGCRARKLAPMTLDLSGIAKGFGVDTLARVIEEAGIGSYLVGIDGEMRARGPKPDGLPWSVALERPDRDRRTAHGVVAIEAGAVATSGDYRHSRGEGQDRVSHSMDPRTGRPVRNAVASVTVLAATAMVADALATALLVMGREAGLRFAESLGIEALMLVRDPLGGIIEQGTGRFAATAPTPVSAPAAGRNLP